MKGKTSLGLIQTEIANKYVNDAFEKELAKALKLVKVTAPICLSSNSGLNGAQSSADFTVGNEHLELVNTLAKWNRLALVNYGLDGQSGIYTDTKCFDGGINGVAYPLSKWEWEKTIDQKDATITFLKKAVRKVYAVIKKSSAVVWQKYPQFKIELASDITFVSSVELEKDYPALSIIEREKEITKYHRAVFISKLGYPLKNGKPHREKAADIEDWKLNGEILVWDDKKDNAVRLSQMGIRVSASSLLKQLRASNETEKLDNPFCKDIINGALPITVGGSIEQAKLFSLFI